jgi:hypothetical protein
MRYSTPLNSLELSLEIVILQYSVTTEGMCFWEQIATPWSIAG